MDGVINVLKPPGLTSSDVVSDIRKILNIKRVGHTGTLDPGAAGVLPVCIGNATRIFDYLVNKNKTYIAEVAFGYSTLSQDSYSTVTSNCDCNVTLDQINAVLREFTGKIEQVIPMYSSVKQSGRRLYKLARSGEIIEPKTRSIEIFNIKLISQTSENRFLFEVECSKGTYIRTLCYDIGKHLGIPAYMSFLLRKNSGEFDIIDSYTLEELRLLNACGRLSEAIIPTDIAISHIPVICLNDSDARTKRLISNGAEVDVSNIAGGICEPGDLRVYCGEFIGIGRITDSKLRIVTKLMAEQENQL